MEIGKGEALFDLRDESELLAIATKNEAEMPYHKEEWKPNEKLFLMDDNELKAYKRESEEEIKKVIDKLFEETALEGATAVEFFPLREEVLKAREVAITYGDVSIVPLYGQETKLYEYLGDELTKKAWEFEPHPNFEFIVGLEDLRGFSTTVFRVADCDMGKLWSILEEKYREIKETDIAFPDIRNLTPDQAVFLVSRLIKDRMNYEQLITGKEMKRIVETIKKDLANNEKATSREDLLELAESDPKRLKKEAETLKNRIDGMRADELLEYRFGVCRHIAATEQVLYKLLREKQDGLLLNGSYLIYHDEEARDQKTYGLIENHAYNVLIVTNPKEEGGVSMSASVLDPTFMLSSEKIDYTDYRLSQVVSFLSVYGKRLGVENNEETCKHLAREAAERLETHMLLKGTNKYINDYASLVMQIGEYDEKGIIARLKEVFTSTNLDKVDFLSMLFRVPVLSKSVKDESKNEKRVLRNNFRSVVVDEIKEYGFDNPVYLEESEKLRHLIEQSLDDERQYWVEELRRARSEERRKKLLTEENLSYFRLAGEYVRACVELKKAPNDKMEELLDFLSKLDTQNNLGILDQESVKILHEIWLYDEVT